MTTLYVRDLSGFREAAASDVLDRAQALLAQRYRIGSPVLTSPALTRDFLRVHLGACEHEVFGVLHLDLCFADGYVELSAATTEFLGDWLRRYST
jgi:DNA repair protein RadC